MINIWRQIDTLPKSKETFLGARSIDAGRKGKHALLRRGQTWFRHEFEQFVNNDWHPAFFAPKYWKRTDDGASCEQ